MTATYVSSRGRHNCKGEVVMAKRDGVIFVSCPQCDLRYHVAASVPA